MATTSVDLDSQETMILLTLLKTRAAELDRMIQNLEEGEGMDLQRHNALKTMRPQAETLETLVMKLEGASRELAGHR